VLTKTRTPRAGGRWSGTQEELEKRGYRFHDISDYQMDLFDADRSQGDRKEVEESIQLDRRDLEKLRGLRVEIESLQHIRPKSQTVSIFYKDYRTGIGIPKTDVGLDSGEEERRELDKKIMRKERQLSRQVSEIEDWLDSVPDPEMRTILRYYYAEGMSQREIGEKLGYDRSTITKRIHMFWASL